MPSRSCSRILKVCTKGANFCKIIDEQPFCNRKWSFLAERVLKQEGWIEGRGGLMNES